VSLARFACGRRGCHELSVRAPSAAVSVFCIFVAAIAAFRRGLGQLPPSLLAQANEVIEDRQALPSGSHAGRLVQGSLRQEYWAADAGGPA
jgi:hypothetical protein